MSQPVFLISGWGYSARVFTDELMLSRQFIRLDYSKHCLNNLSELACQLSTEIKDQANIIAWSFGGLLAILLADQLPQLIHRLVLISSQPKMVADDYWVGIGHQDAAHFINMINEGEAAIKARLLNLSAYPDRQLEVRRLLKAHMSDLTTPHMLKLLHEMFLSDLRSIYSNLNCKILHIINERDAILKQDHHALKKLNPNVSVEIINHAGHAGFLTHQGQYRDIINVFLNSNEYH